MDAPSAPGGWIGFDWLKLVVALALGLLLLWAVLAGRFSLPWQTASPPAPLAPAGAPTAASVGIAGVPGGSTAGQGAPNATPAGAGSSAAPGAPAASGVTSAGTAGASDATAPADAAGASTAPADAAGTGGSTAPGAADAPTVTGAPADAAETDGSAASAAPAPADAAGASDAGAPAAEAPPWIGAVPAPAMLPATFPPCTELDVGCRAFIAAPPGTVVELRPAADLTVPAAADLPGGAPALILEVLRGGPDGTWWRLLTADGQVGWVHGDATLQLSRLQP